MPSACREVRLALGAHPRDLTSAIVREGSRLGALGAAAGVIVGAGVSRLLAAQARNERHAARRPSRTVTAVAVIADFGLRISD